MMTNVEFYPAALIGHFNKITKDPTSRKYSFWGEGSFFQYDKLLYSYYYLQQRYKKLEDDESYFDFIGYDGKRMIDSGGFQVRTQSAEIDPLEVLECYKRERADIGIVLDDPKASYQQYSQKLADKMKENVQIFIDNKDDICPDTEILNVSHGITLKDRKRYYQELSEHNGKLDGWSIGLIKRVPPIYNAWSFLYLLSQDETLKDKRVHFLGLTGNRNLPVMYYLAKHDLVENISFDSTKYAVEGMFAEMRNPAFKKERLRIGNKNTGELDSNKFCPCPVCSNLDIQEMKDDTNFCVLHNLFWETKKMDFFDSFKSPEDIKEFVFESGLFDDLTKTAILFCEYAIENGLEDAELKFKSEFKSKVLNYESDKIDNWL